jgi:transposase InsO family protein
VIDRKSLRPSDDSKERRTVLDWPNLFSFSNNGPRNSYIPLSKEFVYLSVSMDVFARCIRGWHLGRSPERELTLRSLRAALERGCPEIHHSDRGVQDAATANVARSSGRLDRVVGFDLSPAGPR